MFSPQAGNPPHETTTYVKTAQTSVEEKLGQVRRRPELAQVVEVVADHFGADPAQWTSGRRSNDAARAVAAFLARRRFGYPAGEIAAALGYRDHSGVGRAVRRVEQATAKLKRDVKKLESVLNP